MTPRSAAGWLCACMAAGAGAAAAQPAPDQVALVCEAVYLPARTTWVRRVAIDYDAQRVKAVRIDGVPVYSFAIAGTVILTSLDNERVQIDTAAQTWTSDFRGLASAQGRCERE